MNWEKNKATLDSLLAAGKNSELRGALMMLNVVDIAEYMTTLETDKMLRLYRLLPKDISADDVMNPPAWLQSERAHWLRVTREAVEGLHGKSCAAVGQSGGSISLSWALWTFHDKQQFGIYDWSQADRSKRFIPELTAALGLPKPPPAN